MSSPIAKSCRYSYIATSRIKMLLRRTFCSRSSLSLSFSPSLFSLSSLHLSRSFSLFYSHSRRIGWMSGKWDSRRVRHFPFPREFNSRDSRGRNFVSCEFATLMEFRRQSRCLGCRLLVLPLILPLAFLRRALTAPVIFIASERFILAQLESH